ncbi:MAG: hypothetical protein ACRDGJ_09005 [Candidatus Limnocylindria bacterium]
MVRPVLIVALVVVAAGPVAAPAEYDLDWKAFARLVRADEAEAGSGEIAGRAVARLVRVSPGIRRLEFRGPDGEGGGLIGPDGPVDFRFPVPVDVGFPPAVPHLSGGSFEVSGDPERPDGFLVFYVEGFICRATPRTCGGVSMWERRFEGRGTRR